MSQKQENKEYSIILCTKQKPFLIDFIKSEVDPADELIITDLPKYPYRFLDKLFFDLRSKYAILVSELSTIVEPGFIKNLKNNTHNNGLLFSRTDDMSGNMLPILAKQIKDDDSLCIPLNGFRGFRNANTHSMFPALIKEIVSKHNLYGPRIRQMFEYDNIIKETRALKTEQFFFDVLKSKEENEKRQREYEEGVRLRKESIYIFYSEEEKKRKQAEERKIRTVNTPKSYVAVNKKVVNRVLNVSKVKHKDINSILYQGDWCTWMEQDS